MILVRRTVLEQKAKQIQKLKKLQWSKALDEAAKEFQFSNYRHFLNAIKDSVHKDGKYKSISEFSTFVEFLSYLNSLNAIGVNEACIKAGFVKQVEDYLLDLFNKRFLTVDAFIPNKLQRLNFDFLNFNFSAEEKIVKITGNIQIQIKDLEGKLFEYKGAMKKSNAFDAHFLIILNPDMTLRLDNIEINGKSIEIN